jgi:hypothetical protein
LIEDLGDDRRRITITSPDATEGPPGARPSRLL